MLWFLIPIIGIIGKVIYDVETEGKPLHKKKSILEFNIERLQRELDNNSGKKIAIIGQPGAGKSSLLKKMTNGKVIPLPVIGTQTDATNWADDLNCNLLSHYKTHVFVDVPGYDTSSHPTSSFSSFPFSKFDAFILIIRDKLHHSDEIIFQLAAQSKKNLFIARSFSSNLDSSERESVEIDIRTRLLLGKTFTLLFFDNRTGEGIPSIFSKINY